MHWVQFIFIGVITKSRKKDFRYYHYQIFIGITCGQE